MNRTITVCADVEVDVDLSRFPTDVLLEELRERQRENELEEAIADYEASVPSMVPAIPPLNSEVRHPMHDIYYALKFGKPTHALDLMRDYVSDQLGVVL